MFRIFDNFNTLLDKATSHLLTEPDWPSILQICDLISKKAVPPKYALYALNKKVRPRNETTDKHILLILESMIVNCGFPILDELMATPFSDKLYVLAKITKDKHGGQKMLQMIEAWKIAHCRSPKREPLKDTMQFDTIRMQSEGSKFPSSQESDAMLGVASSSKKQDGDVCYGCRTAFESPQSRCLCGRCEQVFCTQCFQKKVTLPNVGTEKEYRVCDACYNEVTERKELTAEEQSAKGKSKIYTVKGADINKTFSDGHTPLTHAVIRGNTQLLEDLLNRGADPNKEDESGKTPLSMAAIAGNLEMVKILLDRGAGATIQTAFLDAIQSKNLDIVKYMKEKGAKMNWANKHGLTPLMKALHVEGADDIVKYLIENGTALDEQLEFSLAMEKVKQKNLEFLKILVDLGADLNQVDRYGFTPLTKATELEHFEIVKYLLRNGTDVNYPKIDGKTALAIAAANGFYQIATFLVRWRADVNLARAEVEDYAEWNEDFDIFLKTYKDESLF